MGQSTNGGGTPFASTNWGADKNEWAVFVARLGLIRDILPVVCNPNAKIHTSSKIKKAGKLPSRYTGTKVLVGFPKWTEHETTKNEVRDWINEPDYGICIQTRLVRAIDVDIADQDKAEEIGRIIERYLGVLPRRIRSNSSRFLVVFRMEGSFSKRFLGSAADDNLVEFLATGQQFVAAGTHTSGVRYAWNTDLSSGIPEVAEEDFERAWTAISVHHTGKLPLPDKKQKKLEANNDLVGPVDYPPSSAERVATHCAQIKFFKDTGCDYEPHWRLCAGVVKHTVEGEDLVHEWSERYSGYDATETQVKLDGWTTPPPTCGTFGNYGGMCEKCKFLGKVRSPIQLGHEMRSSVVEDGHQEDEVEEVVDPDDTQKLAVGPQPGGKLVLPAPFCVNKNRLCYQKTVDDIVKPIPICDMLFYPVQRTRTVDGTVVLTINARTRHDGKRWLWNTFDMEASTIGGGGYDLMKQLGSYEIVPLNGGKEYMDLYMKSYMDELRRTRDEVKSFRTFGWHESGIVHGADLITEGNTPRKIAVGGTLAPGYANAFKYNAYSEEAAKKWAAIVKEAYGRPGHEQYQMVLAAGFGSVLVNMFELNMGGPINLYGGRGMGKTTVCKFALSMWGDPDQMYVTGKDGATINAMYARMSALSSFPWLVDEITSLSGEEVSRMYYHVANAMPKDTLTRDRKRADPFPPWNCMGFTTSNDSQIDKIAAFLSDGSAEMSRTLEVEWRRVKTMDMMDMATLIDDLKGTYGAAGRVFAQYVVDNRAKIKIALYRTRSMLDSSVGMSKEYRFWSVQAACIIVGGLLANKLGLYQFSVDALKEEVVRTLKANLVNLVDRVSTPDDAFHDMLTDLSPNTIVTQHEGDGRAGDMKVEVRCSGVPAVRVVRDKGVAYVSTAAIREWCTRRRIGVNAMKKALEECGVLLDASCKFVLGKGTTMNTGQSTCWKVDIDRAHGVDINKVTQMKLVS